MLNIKKVNRIVRLKRLFKWDPGMLHYSVYLVPLFQVVGARMRQQDGRIQKLLAWWDLNIQKIYLHSLIKRIYNDVNIFFSETWEFMNRTLLFSRKHVPNIRECSEIIRIKSSHYSIIIAGMTLFQGKAIAFFVNIP